MADDKTQTLAKPPAPDENGAANSKDSKPLESDAQHPEIEPSAEPQAKPNEPPEGSPRWREVYGNWKSAQRTMGEQQKDIETLREHNRKLAAAMDNLNRSKADKPADVPPDFSEDPDAAKKWYEFDREKREKQHKDEIQSLEIKTMINIESGIHSDYDAVIKLADKDMERDPDLQKKIWSSSNPPRVAYLYGKGKLEEIKKMEEEERARGQNIDQTSVERGGYPEPSEPGNRLTDDEKRVIRNLFPDTPYKEAEKQYIAQKKYLNAK